MANPEHIKILKAGKEAIDEWRKRNSPKNRLDLSGITLEDLYLVEVNLSDANLRGSTIKDSCLENVIMCSIDLREANLKNLCLNFANLNSSDLRCAHFEGSEFIETGLEDCDARGAYFNNALLNGTSLMWSWFSFCDFSGADLELARFHKTHLEGARLDGVKLSPLDSAHWDITDVICSHFFLDGKRIPEKGYLLPNEFEGRYKSRPTIEFVFEQGMNALTPAVLGVAIDQANLERPEITLRLLSIDARGGIPRAIIEVAEKVSKKDALALVHACYQQKFAQMQKEIKGLKDDKQVLLQLTTQKMLLPAMASAEGYFSCAELAKQHQVDPEALRKRLDRHRANYALDTDFYVESQDRGANKPKYLYNAKMIAPIVESLKKKRTSFKRPSEKK